MSSSTYGTIYGTIGHADDELRRLREEHPALMYVLAASYLGPSTGNWVTITEQIAQSPEIPAGSRSQAYAPCADRGMLVSFRGEGVGTIYVSRGLSTVILQDTVRDSSWFFLPQGCKFYVVVAGEGSLKFLAVETVPIA